jgi:DNA-binding NarL/FixJ family response regulator
VLIDWYLPGRPSAEIIAALDTLDPRPKVVVLSSKLDVEEAALDADADVFVSKGDPPKNLLIALHLMKSEIEEQATKQVDKSAEV